MLKIIKEGLSSSLLIIDKLDKKFKLKRIFFISAKKKVLLGFLCVRTYFLNHSHDSG